MKFLHPAEVRAWWQRYLPSGPEHAAAAAKALDANFEAGGDEFCAAARVAGWLLEAGSREEQVLADVQEHGVWASSENLHLYYLWRRWHGDQRLLEEAPGHLFLQHEQADLATLLHLGLLFGWGICCAARESGRVFRFDHDGRATASAADARSVEELAANWRK